MHVFTCIKERNCFTYVDSEKAFDRVTREVTKMGITAEDCIVNAVMALYNGTQMDSRRWQGF